MKTLSHPKTLRMVQTAVLAAIIILMAFTPLGYLRAGPVSITFLTIPVVVGAIIIGPVYGAILGGVFGLTSFAQCFGIDWFGTTLMGINPFYTFIMTMIPRIILGFAAGHIFRVLARIDKTKIISFIVATLSGAVINTVLFVGALLLFFYSSEFIQGFGETLWAVLTALVTFNALIEIVVAMIVGTALAKVLLKAFAPNEQNQSKKITS